MKTGLLVLVLGLVSTCAFAAQRVGTDASWVTAIVAAAVSGSASVLLTLRVKRRETNANADKLEADAVLTSTETVTKLLAQVNSLVEEVASARADVRVAEIRATASEQQVRDLTKRLARVEEIAAIAVATNRLQDYHEFVDLFDLIPTPMVFSSAGTFEWVNVAMCRALGRDRHELLGANWRALVLPEDLESTSREETAAHRRRVWGFRNRYRNRDGSVVTFDWYTAVYKDGGTIGFAFEVRTDAQAQAVFAAEQPLVIRRNTP